jgi:hypothetical protein
LAVLVISALVALCAGLVSRSAWRPGSVGLPWDRLAITVPWGLVLAVAGSVSLVVIARALAGRAFGFIAAAGWVGGVAATLVWHPGGDYLFANDALGISFLLVATGAVLVAAGWGA